jgi:dUTP pyrophosphatase
MVISVEELKKYITSAIGIEENQIQVNGIDLRVDKIYEIISFGTLFIDEVKLPSYKEIIPEKIDDKYVFFLQEGVYLLEFFEIIEIPPDAIGICFPRSSLLRMGCDIRTALWDSGYKGKSRALLVVHKRVAIEKGARVAQIIFLRTESKSEKLYKGRYQNEGIK